MKKRTAFLVIVCLLVIAVAVPGVLSRRARDPETHVISLTAHTYAYSPHRIVVNQGDTIILKPTSKDVTHGFYLDGYNVEFIIKQEGLALLKYDWTDEDGTVHTDWDKVRQVKFVADKAGKFVFRCTQTCGNLHPFMTGELIVRPNRPYIFAVSLSLWLASSLLIGFFARKDTDVRRGRRFNLTRSMPWLTRLVKWRGYHFFILFPSVAIFYLFILSALWGSPVGNRNIAVIIVWILWWFLLKALFVPTGARLWCMICPLPAPAEWLGRKALTAVHYVEKPFRGLHHRYLGQNRDWPKPLRNMWLQNIVFMTMISFGIILITRPVATAIMFLGILVATLVLALFFRRRVFCQYLCPVGGFLGNYAMASMTEIRAVDPDVCRHHKEKSCLTGSPNGWGCAWNQYIGTMNRNNLCGFCMECIKSCPKDNIGIFARPFGEDRRIRGTDEMTNIVIMLVVAIAFSVTMLGPWGVIKDAANVTETGRILPWLVYVGVLWGSALVIVPRLFRLTAKTANRMAGRPAPDREVTLQLAYVLVPVGIFAWIAFSLPPLMINYHYILGVLSDPLGLGWNLFGTADFPFHPLIPGWIPIIQGVLLLAGLYFGIHRGHRAILPLAGTPQRAARLMVLPSLFVLLAINVLLRLYMG
jgi:polyferredoxin